MEYPRVEEAFGRRDVGDSDGVEEASPSAKAQRHQPTRQISFSIICGIARREK